VPRIHNFLVPSIIVLVAALAASSRAQTPRSSPLPTEAPVQVKASQPTKATDNSSPIKRWLDIDALSVSTRYRYVNARNGATLLNQQQWQFVARGRFKFDKKAKYSVYMGLFTGPTFTGGWNNTGWGTGNFQSNLFLKHLYFDAKPVKGLEFQVGGFGVSYGENTEITTYDNDSYLTGGRVMVRKPKKLYFDEVSVTFAHLGELTRPGIFRRLNHIDNLNYHQFLVRKLVNNRVSFSADYTFESGKDFLHEGVKFKVPETRLFDTILFESYQRLDINRGIGFNLYGEKVALKKKLTVGGGFARNEQLVLNSDRFPVGHRFYLQGLYKFTPEFSIGTVFVRGVDLLRTPLTQRTRLDIIFQYNILETLKRFKVL
jgi:hypothetical protein